MRKLNKKLIGAMLLIVIAIVVVVIFMSNKSQSDYKLAFAKTEDLTSYDVGISTQITLQDGENLKHSAIDQNVLVYNKNKSDMRYNVSTVATSEDVNTGEVVTEQNSYLYHNETYYYTYPGVRYKSPTEKALAEDNIKNLTNIITFPYDKMYNLKSTEMENGTVYDYEVDFSDASLYVKATLESAINVLGEGNFSLDSVSASATVSEGYVKERELCVSYKSGEDKIVTVEIFMTLNDVTATVEVPDESKYADIMAQ